MMKNPLDEDRIREALELLNQAADEDGERLLKVVTDRYESLKRLVNTRQRDLSAMYNAGREKVLVTAEQFDSHVHAKPWAYIGAGVALGLLLGALIARRRD